MTLLGPGHNLALTTHQLTFAATGTDAVDLSVLVLSNDRRAATSDDFVFYNHPAGTGARLTRDHVGINLDDIRPDAVAMLCLASHPDAHLPGSHPLRPVRATLRDAAGTPLCTADAVGTGVASALICFELYRRGHGWKVRALGHGFDGGLRELISAHGVPVADEQPPSPAPQPDIADGTAPVTPLDVGRPAERLWMILEDAARSAAAWESASAYAFQRLEADLSAAAADPSSRHGPAADHRRREAQQRHDDVLRRARERYADDSTYLVTELATISPDLPRALAPWGSVAWSAGIDPSVVTDGLRVGDLRAPSRGDLVVPWITRLPMRRPLWIDTTSSAAARDTTSALVLRLLSARSPSPQLEIVDLTGSLDRLTTRLTRFMPAGVVRQPADITSRLRSVVDAVELRMLAQQRGMAELAPPERVAVLADFPHGFSSDDIEHVVGIVSQGPHAGVPLLIVGDDESESADQRVAALWRFSEHVPAATDIRFRDPWTGTDWELAADSAPADDRVVESIVGLLR